MNTIKQFKIYKPGVTTNGMVTIVSIEGQLFDRDAKIAKYLTLDYRVYDMNDRRILKSNGFYQQENNW